MSATPKVYKLIKDENYEEQNLYIYKNVFGKVEYSYKFEDSIKNKFINDYIIIFPNNETEKK